jgi:hypothetical protein
MKITLKKMIYNIEEGLRERERDRKKKEIRKEYSVHFQLII